MIIIARTELEIVLSIFLLCFWGRKQKKKFSSSDTYSRNLTLRITFLRFREQSKLSGSRPKLNNKADSCMILFYFVPNRKMLSILLFSLSIKEEIASSVAIQIAAFVIEQM